MSMEIYGQENKHDNSTGLKSLGLTIFINISTGFRDYGLVNCMIIIAQQILDSNVIYC